MKEGCLVCDIVRLVTLRRYPFTAAHTTASIIVMVWPTESLGTALVLAKRHASAMDDAIVRRCQERDLEIVRDAIRASFQPTDVEIDRMVGHPHTHVHVLPVYAGRKIEKADLACCKISEQPSPLEDKKALFKALNTFRVNLASIAHAQDREDLSLDLLQQSTYPPPAP